MAESRIRYEQYYTSQLLLNMQLPEEKSPLKDFQGRGAKQLKQDVNRGLIKPPTVGWSSRALWIEAELAERKLTTNQLVDLPVTPAVFAFPDQKKIAGASRVYIIGHGETAEDVLNGTIIVRDQHGGEKEVSFQWTHQQLAKLIRKNVDHRHLSLLRVSLVACFSGCYKGDGKGKNASFAQKLFDSLVAELPGENLPPIPREKLQVIGRMGLVARREPGRDHNVINDLRRVNGDMVLIGATGASYINYDQQDEGIFKSQDAESDLITQRLPREIPLASEPLPVASSATPRQRAAEIKTPNVPFLFQELNEGTILLSQLFNGEHGGEASLISLFNDMRGKGFKPLDNPLENFEKNRNMMQAAVKANMLTLLDLAFEVVKKTQDAQANLLLATSLIGDARSCEMLELLQRQGAINSFAQRVAINKLSELDKNSPERVSGLASIIRMIKQGNYEENQEAIILTLEIRICLSSDERPAIEAACLARRRQHQRTQAHAKGRNDSAPVGLGHVKLRF